MEEKLKIVKEINVSSDGCNCEQKIREEAIKWFRTLRHELVLLPNDSVVKINGANFTHSYICGAMLLLKVVFEIEDKT